MIISRTKRAVKVKTLFLASRVLAFRLKKQTTKNVAQPLRDNQHSMNMVLDTRFHIWLIMILYYKMRQILFKNATAVLLQNATKVYHKMHQVFYCKMRQFYYKIRQLLQNGAFITNCDCTQNTSGDYFCI